MPRLPALRLIEADDAAFAALLTSTAPPPLTLAEPGWESPETLSMLRELAAQIGVSFRPSAWLIVQTGEVVGLCSLISAPNEAGAVEIGYGIAPSRRGQGMATRAVAALLVWAGGDARIRMVTANTAVNNPASRIVLEKNGFARTGRRHNEEDGEMECWARNIES